MALEFFLYTEDYNNTLIERSDTSFAPLTGDTGQILTEFLIPETQPLYLFKEKDGFIVPNDDATVNLYLEGTAPPPIPEDSVTQYQFTGYSATTDIRLDDMTVVITGNTEDITSNLADINYLSGVTNNNSAAITINASNITGNTAYIDLVSGNTVNNAAAITINAGNITSNLANINTRVYRSGDTMTGTLCTSSNLFANGAVTGSSVSASVLMTTPILNASTSVCAPQISGSTCITTPISCATTRMQAPVVCGGTCVISPITIGSSCLCSLGTTGLDGGVTAASFLNVSGDTTFDSQLYMNNPSCDGTLDDYGVKWDPVTKQIRTIPLTGGTANVYCYSDNRVQGNNTTDVDATYLTETWILPSGYYEYEYSAIYGNNTSNRCAIICFLFDGVVVGSCNLIKTNDTNVRATAYITQNNSVTAGIHTAAMVYRQCGGGTASVYTGTIRIQKIGT